jgi:hypothetical protein
VKSRPVLAAAFTFLLGGVIYLASHTIAEERADAHSHQTPTQQVKPNQTKPATPAPQAMHPEKPKAEAASKEEITERRNDQAKRKELCKKLEQRRAELREEKRAKESTQAQ